LFMKKSLLTVFSVVCFLHAGLLRAQSIPELLYYKFDGSGTSVPNYASAPPPGTATATLMGGLTQGGSNICNGTVIGTGVASSTDYVNTGWATNLNGTSWTISMRTSNITGTSTLYYIFGDGTANSFRCFTNGVAGANNWILRGPVTDIYVNGGATAAPHMTTFVYDMAAGFMYGYLDGVLVSTVAQAAPTISGTGPFKVIGYNTNVGAPSNGYLDEFRVYSHALTAAEVMDLYNPFANSGFLGPNQYVCPGDTSYLNIDLPHGSLLWSNASTADSLLVNVADTFSVNISGACGAGNDTIVFISAQTFDSIAATSCVSYASPAGNTYTTTGLYTDTIANSLGCDSIISIDLHITNSSASSINPTFCNVPDYTAPSGAVYNTSGTYLDTIPNFTGCDSVITINLTLAPNTTSNITPTLCGGIYTAPSGATYSASGVFNDTILNSVGCDSIITINLTINTVNTGVNQSGTNGENMSAIAIGTYQWIDCATMTPIAGQTFGNFTATANGTYAVIVTENGCTDTSACFTVAGLGINQNILADLVKLYPNPTTGAFTINLGMINEGFTIELLNNVGQVLKTTLFNNTDQGQVEIEGASGLYFVRITNQQGEKTILRIIKE
jgi:hypothetical protein